VQRARQAGLVQVDSVNRTAVTQVCGIRRGTGTGAGAAGKVERLVRLDDPAACLAYNLREGAE
jgi:hypothetical protein